MKIIFRQIGVLQQLELDFRKRFFVFCGPNNSGKTYGAIAIQTLYRLVAQPTAWAKHIPLPDEISQLRSTGEVEIDMARWFAQQHEAMADALHGAFSEAIKQAFPNGAQHPNLQQAEVLLRLQPQEWAIYFEQFTGSDALLLPKATHYMAWQKLGGTLQLKVKLYQAQAGPPQPERAPIELENLLKVLLVKLCLHPIIGNAFLAGGSREFSTTYPFTEQTLASQPTASDAANPKTAFRKQGAFAGLAKELERELLNGQLKVDRKGNIGFEPFEGPPLSGKILPMSQAAAMIRSVAPLVLFLRYQAQDGDLLLFDEPEMNLHPANQVYLARFLAKLMNRGFRVLITTHSDYLIREINNLILLGSLPVWPKKLAKRFGYQEGEALQHNLLEVLAFNDGKVAKIKVEPDGFQVSQIDDVIANLNLAADALFRQWEIATSEEGEKELKYPL